MTPNPQQHEHDIDAALGILRSAQPASGNPVSGHSDEAFAAMNARLLHNLRASQGRATRTSWLSLPRLAFTVAALAVVFLLPRLHSGPNQTSSVTTSGAPAMVLSSRMDSTEPHPAALQTARIPSGKQVPLATVSSNSRASATPATLHSIGVDPAFLPGQPAPEEPLTHQERLLLSMVNRRKPILLALLESTEPDLSVPRQSADANPFLGGFQPENQSGPRSASQPGTDPDDPPQPVPQP